MRFIKYVAILAILVQTACISRNKEVPAHLLSPEKMQLVMKDAIIAEAYIMKIRPPQDSAKKVTAALYTDLLKKHDLDKRTFYESYAYYTRHPDLWENVFPGIIDSLSSMEAALIKSSNK